MNILLVSSKYMPEYSGSGFRAHNLYKRLCSKNSEINLTILCGSVTENSNKKYEYDGFLINRIAAKRFPQLSLNSVVRKLQIAMNFRSEFNLTQSFFESCEKKPDVIHIFGQDYIGVAALQYANQNNVPVLIELCNEMTTPYHYIPFPYRLFLSDKPKTPFKYICISERLKIVCIKNGIPENNIWCRPNPVNEQCFQPVDQRKRSHYRKLLSKFTPDDKLIVYIAKFIPRKNHRFLLDVIKNLPDNYKLFIGGPIAESGPLKSEGEKIIKNINEFIEIENLTQRVQLQPGFCKNIEHYYQMADAYAFPTKEEGLGTPMLEAVACAVPVVANRIPGITDSWIKNGENGYIADLESLGFANKVQKACELHQEQMQSEAEKIISVAGTEVIDAGYLDRIKDIID